MFEKSNCTFTSERSFFSLIPRRNHPQKKLLKYRQECTRHGQKGKSQKEQICTLNGRHEKCRRSINFGKYSNLGHLEWKLLKYWQEHAQHRQPQMLENRKLVPLPPNDPFPIWSQNKTTFKGSYWTTDKNIFDIDEKNIRKRRFVP